MGAGLGLPNARSRSANFACFVLILGGTPVEGNDFSPVRGVPKIN